MDTKDGAKEVYNILTLRLAKRKDVDRLSRIQAMKDGNGIILRDDEDIELILMEHSKTLKNVENERELTDVINLTEGSVKDVIREEVDMAPTIV